MIEVAEHENFRGWIRGLRDRQAQAIVVRRIGRIRLGNFGDAKAVGDGVMELRIDFGPGYRVYFCKRGESYVLLLAGGDKDTQAADIAKAKQLAASLP